MELYLYAIIIGTLIGTVIWTYKRTILALDFLVECIEIYLLAPVVRFATFLHQKWGFIQWKKKRLPELQEKTRHNDRDALAERIVKSAHTYEDQHEN